MDTADKCQICGEPFEVGRDSDGQEFYLDRHAVVETGKPKEIKMLCHGECRAQCRLWRRILRLEAMLAGGGSRE